MRPDVLSRLDGVEVSPLMAHLTSHAAIPTRLLTVAAPSLPMKVLRCTRPMPPAADLLATPGVTALPPPPRSTWGSIVQPAADPHVIQAALDAAAPRALPADLVTSLGRSMADLRAACRLREYTDPVTDLTQPPLFGVLASSPPGTTLVSDRVVRDAAGNEHGRTFEWTTVREHEELIQAFTAVYRAYIRVRAELEDRVKPALDPHPQARAPRALGAGLGGGARGLES